IAARLKIPKLSMAGLDPATQSASVGELNYEWALLTGAIGRVDTRPLGGRVKPAHGEEGKLASAQFKLRH
ncbi:MAG: hypothetical protein ABSC92_14195, partial [Rhizomicrobium sp.]